MIAVRARGATIRIGHDPSSLDLLPGGPTAVVTTHAAIPKTNPELVEARKRGIPGILRQYLKLNGRILGFNVDPDFNNAIDCLLWVDLARTEVPLLRKYMGIEGAERFLLHHGLSRRDAAIDR